jgi:hypothetical protein
MAAALDPRVADLINYADPDDARTGMVLAPDLTTGRVDPAFLAFALRSLGEVLADETVSTADLKGALNRASAGTWGMDYDRAFTPREFLEALRTAIEAHLPRPPRVTG